MSNYIKFEGIVWSLENIPFVEADVGSTEKRIGEALSFDPCDVEVYAKLVDDLDLLGDGLHVVVDGLLLAHVGALAAHQRHQAEAVLGVEGENGRYGLRKGLVDRLVELGKRFDYMAYPNRDHGLREGRGTAVHLRMLMVRYLLEHLPPGPR